MFTYNICIEVVGPHSWACTTVYQLLYFSWWNSLNWLKRFRDRWNLLNIIIFNQFKSVCHPPSFSAPSRDNYSEDNIKLHVRKPIAAVCCVLISFTFIKHVLWNWNIFTGTNTFQHAEFKSENFPRRKPAVFSQNAILSSLISQQIFSLFNDTYGSMTPCTIISLKTTNFY
jgi:hypothetical protein